MITVNKQDPTLFHTGLAGRDAGISEHVRDMTTHKAFSPTNQHSKGLQANTHLPSDVPEIVVGSFRHPSSKLRYCAASSLILFTPRGPARTLLRLSDNQMCTTDTT